MRACGIMIEAAQTLYSQKWLSASALEDEEVVQIKEQDVLRRVF